LVESGYPSLGPGVAPTEQLLRFAAATPPAPELDPASALSPWKLLIVDDEPEVHTLTRLVLRGYEFEGRRLELISAYSGHEARRQLDEHPDVAVILLDVVMEREDSGLLLVEHIREQLGNRQVRIILRTGQPGQAPEFEVVARYDINDYKSKIELTSLKLQTTVTSALRAWRDIQTIEQGRQGLARLVAVSGGLFAWQSRSKLLRSVLKDLIILATPQGLEAGPKADGQSVSGLLARRTADGYRVVAGEGCYAGSGGLLVNEVVPDRASVMVAKASRRGEGIFFNHSYVCCLEADNGDEALFLIQGSRGFGGMPGILIQLYMANVATALHNVGLSQEIIATQCEIIQTLGEVVETRSQETANHVRRVGCMAELLAIRSGLDIEQASLLRMAAPMHDIGKVGIPDAILNKPGKLTPAEYCHIQRHATIGYEILAKSERPLMKAAAIVAVQHHERWDGRGYPNGLAGHDIHPFGRITALVDVFDAMSNPRVYRPAMDPEHVMQVIRDGAGTRFDPDLTAVFLAHIEEFRAVMERLPDGSAPGTFVLVPEAGAA
jgi:response regulator RpfG family c-di-GMP phosphodiesterase